MTQYNPYATQQPQYGQPVQQPTNQDGYELDYDGVITKDSEFVLITPGEYDFTVESFSLGYYNGGDKVPACKRVDVNLIISAPEGDVKVQKGFFLYSKFEWVLSSFFMSLGMKRKGEPLKMNWNATVGVKGRCKIGRRSSNNGNEYNEVKEFIPRPDMLQPATQSPYTPGAF